MGGKTKPANPRTPFVPTEEQRYTVRNLAGKMDVDDIALVILNPATAKGISPRTLQKYFRRELKTGRAQLKALALNNVAKLMEGGHPSMTMFFLKTQCGWREREKDEPPPAADDPSTMAAKMRALAAKMEAASRGPTE